MTDVQILFPIIAENFFQDMMSHDWAQQQWQSIWGRLLFCY